LVHEMFHLGVRQWAGGKSPSGKGKTLSLPYLEALLNNYPPCDLAAARLGGRLTGFLREEEERECPCKASGHPRVNGVIGVASTVNTRERSTR